MSILYFYTATLSFFLGVLLATLFQFSLPQITWLVLICFVLILIWYRSTLLVEEKKWLFFGLLLVAFSLGTLRLEVANWSFGNSLLENEVETIVTIQGLVSSEPDIREKVTNLEVKTKADKVLVLMDKYQTVSYGDFVEVTGKLTKPESFKTDLGRTFNYPGYLKAKGIEYKISFAQVKVTKQDQGNLVVSILLKGKHYFMEKIEESISEPAAGLGEGLLLGVKQALGEELETAFRKTGIIHVVVLSGYNIMLVVIFVMYILGQFLNKKPKIVVGILAIVAFALLVGLSATVVRASIMSVLLLLTQFSSRTYLVLRGLMLAGLVMILINPFLLVYDVGFQLSFLATLGLILISPHFEAWFSKIPSLLGMRSFLVATLSTQVAVLPILLYQIGEFSVVAVLVNMLVLPMVPIAMLLTFMTGVVALLSTKLALIFALPAYFSLTYILEIASWFSQLSFAAYNVPAFPFYFVILAYIALGCVLWRFYNPLISASGGEVGEKFLNKKTLTKDEEIDFLKNWIIEEDESDYPKPKVVVDKTTTTKDMPNLFT